MLGTTKTTPWNPFPTRWIWAFILAGQTALFLISYLFLGSRAFFLLGPILTYNLGIYFYPYLTFFFNPVPSSQNRFSLDWQLALKKVFPTTSKLHVFMNPEGSSPLMIYAHRSTLWIMSSESFLAQFNTQETALLQLQIQHLWREGLLANATTWTALQKTLPLRFLRNPRGTELMFAASAFDLETPADWPRLCLKVFHWLSHARPVVQNAASPSLFFPNLTNYSQQSYLSLYQHLQNELVETLKQGDVSYEPTNRRSVVLYPDPLYRLDGGHGSGVGSTPTDRQN